MLQSIFRECIIKSDIRLLSTVANIQLKERSPNFRCSESNPVNHTVDNLAQFYKIPKEDEKQLFSHGGLTKTFKTHCQTFNETCIMIRKPALDIINSLKHIDYSKPAYRFVIYGSNGSGRSLSLAHVVHYGYKAGFLLVHVPWVGDWMRRCKESSVSTLDESLTDLNLDAALWLTHFKNQNSHFLKEEQFKMSRDYDWNKREKILKGAPLSELIDFGISRVKYASQCVVVLADEIKKLSTSGICKTLVLIDGFNAFFHSNTRIFKEKKQIVPPNKVTLTKPFLNLTNFDWTNAAVVLCLDGIAIGQMDSPSEMPRYLLGKEGFEHVDPFVPIPVNNYNEKEFISCLEYYKDRKWIQQYYPELEKELAFVSNSNPFRLLEIVASL
ncbi:hypothetical protein HHI36_019283 [Cryptolaemus montrouzieri]|uniref:Small ribosomal subunit protein mS29 n=1 Tax=Cryptolaemus montrouzieri TaxID=559131 RepID=A0ABD2P2P8_9CUCU